MSFDKETDNYQKTSNRIKFILLSGGIFLILLVSGSLAFILSNYNYVEIQELNSKINGTNITVSANESEIWITLEGNLNNTGDINHSYLGGLQGGDTDEYYHLDQSTFSTLIANINNWLTAITSNELDNICNDDGSILKRVGGTWVCSTDQTGTGNELNYTKTVEANKITLSFTIP